MVDEVVAILEDSDARAGAMCECVSGRFPQLAYMVFDNAPDMIAWLRRNLASVRIMSLDHDLGERADRATDRRVFDPGTGRDVVDFLITEEPTCPVIIHTSNSIGGDGMQCELEGAGWVVYRILPFGSSWIEDEWCAKVAGLMESK